MPPLPLAAFLAAALLLPLLATSEHIGHVTRDYFGDIFTIDDCSPGSCDRGGRRAAQIPGEECRCQCANSHYTFREDLKECIKDVNECPVAMFVRPFAVERIPLVFLPLNGQLVYPGAHLIVSGIAKSNMTCSVRTSMLMTSEGFKPIKKSNIFGIKHYDGNKTFLQWLGGDEERRILQHHLVLIRLRCESDFGNSTYEPCAALRIGWAPGLGPEVPESGHPNKNHFIIIGLCLGILGLIYVLAVLIYLKVRKNRRETRGGNSIEAPEERDGNSQLRNSYINNLVQEAEFTTKSSLKGSSSPEPDRAEPSNSTDGKTGGGEGSEETAQPQEFFVRIRGMISAAKNRLNSFRYRPTLLVIPEDDYYYQDYKERDMEKGLSRKKGNSSKVESIHGGKLGAAMLEAKLAPPLPPPRSTPARSKKRAPSPPEEVLRKGGSLDRNKKRKVVPGQDCSKFDMFRLDLYEKINRLRDGGSTETVLDVKRTGKKDDIVLGESSTHNRNNPKDGYCHTLEAPTKQEREETKISRRELLYKLEENENIEDDETTLKIKVKRRESPDRNIEYHRSSSTPTALYDTRQDMSESHSSSHTSSSHKSEEADNLSECSDASLSGDSLNSSFRKPKSPPIDQSASNSVITSSTAIKEFEDDDDDEMDDTTTQDEEEDDSRVSTDLEYSLADDSEHPSLEEYLQLSNQVAKKLSERSVPSFSTDQCPKEKNVISQFMREFKTTIGRLKSAEEVKPATARTGSPGSDNWTLKSEEKRARVARKVSLFKRNPLKGRKNEEPLVAEEKGGDAVSDDGGESSRSSNSSASGAKSKKYKQKTPEIVPAAGAKVVVDVAEKKIISISDSKSGDMDERYGRKPSPKTNHSRISKTVSVTPPLPPPKPQMKKGGPSFESTDETSDSEHCNILETKTVDPTKSRHVLVRTPSIESDSISVANSDMTEDSLNTRDNKGDKSADDLSEDENGPIDQCLAQLADSVIQPPDDCSLNRYLNHIGNVLATRELDQCLSKLASNMNGNRATKGFNLSNLPICSWEHVCVDKGSDRDRSTPTSDRSSTTSRGSKSSQEILRKKTLTKSNKHHHHHHHECKHNTSGGDSQGDSTTNDAGFTKNILMERMMAQKMKGKSRIASTTSEEEECGRASSLGSTRELETPIPETTSDPGSADLERPRKKRPMFRRSKKGLNGTCRQHIQNNKLNKKENSLPKKGGFKNCGTPRSSGSDVTVITLEGNSNGMVENANTFVTLVNVDSSDCSNSAEEK